MRRADPAIVVDMGIDPGDLQLESPLLLPVMDTAETGDPAEGLR
jgi:hypothetical protein